jgi:hypothetical protein
MGRVTGYYKEQCARHGWQPEPHQIIYRANMPDSCGLAA